ncbi:MAG: DASS family sodium-coupled anion symporter [Gammaproteobacteria bacterium]|jgi:sodium-dependent dicarboxylate transporter 2/3/5
MSRRQWLGLLLGPLLFCLVLVVPAPASMPPLGMKVAAVTVLMGVFWIMEAIPMAATALLPIALFPLLGVMPTAKVTEPYANHLIYLFMGGFLIAAAIEKWQLHKRIALRTVSLVGVSPKRIVLGFMLATAFLSFWISNTAAAMMMVTIGIALLHQLSEAEDAAAETDPDDRSNFATALMLGIAYAASIGGVATLIGTPPNAILAGIAEKHYGIVIGFARWMEFAAPLAAVMLLVTWYFLTHVAFRSTLRELPGGKALVSEQLAALGPMSRPERRVLAVFALVVAAWLFRGLLHIQALAEVTDSSVAITGALLLFLIPADWRKGEFLLDWHTAVRIPWDIIILFGGGFALAGGFGASGLTGWVGSQLSFLHGAGVVIMTLCVVLLVTFLTEVTSNTATASLMLPIMGGFALATDIPPLTLMTGAALAASFAFMLPVATPPNAIVFGSRQVTIPQMVRAGWRMNLFGTLLITLFVTVSYKHLVS